ncbi:hypothetical protein [Frigoribacterium sp. VKM Ac-2836]|uniref:hypothetical protein n=1 Tax=Frigoribacterium sp. VKM Ac-2836 TaxID=2739014 RepID=UPI00156415D7|nr:hypothetical protein [Frigoribacterium sp. VKM Ac-2836]NRD26204.1 hypothetical protein [Frigoribacterium sp. VKM Ac-2836]
MPFLVYLLPEGFLPRGVCGQEVGVVDALGHVQFFGQEVDYAASVRSLFVAASRDKKQ